MPLGAQQEEGILPKQCSRGNGAFEVEAALLAAALQREKNLDFKEANGPFFFFFLTKLTHSCKRHNESTF